VLDAFNHPLCLLMAGQMRLVEKVASEAGV
jgi:hypothetical protein